MVEHNIKRYVFAIVIVFLFWFFIVGIFKGAFVPGFADYFGVLTTSITITAFIVTAFVSFAWRWRIFRGWFVPYPNLNGDWEGSITFDYEGKERTRKIKMQIKQTFTCIIVDLVTNESKSKNFCGSFNIDKNREIKQLIYSYLNEPDVKYRDRSPLHYGTTKLDILPDNKTMEGEYWTDRGTKGSIKLKKK